MALQHQDAKDLRWQQGADVCGHQPKRCTRACQVRATPALTGSLHVVSVPQTRKTARPILVVCLVTLQILLNYLGVNQHLLV
eukprot:5832701-Amphidinium_carterae.1